MEIVFAVNRDREMFFPPDLWAELSALGKLRLVEGVAAHDVDRYASALRGARVVVTGWGVPALSEQVLRAASNLGLMAHTAGSVRRFVTPEMWRRGIRVSQASEALAPAVAESALMMTLILLRRAHRYDHAMHGGEPWSQALQLPFPQREIAGATIGVVGASRIGRVYIGLAKAMGANVRVFDPYLSEADAAELDATRSSLVGVMGSDIVALHAPATEETRNLIGRAQLAAMPDGAGLVNTARAHVIDMTALYDEVSSGRIDVALDVYSIEPLPTDDPWRSLPNVLLMPHVAGITPQARRRGGQIVIDEIRRFREGWPLQHEVTEEMLKSIA